MIEHIMKGIVPRSDDSKDTIGNIFHIGRFVHHHGPNGSIGSLEPFLPIKIDASNLFTGGHYFSEECIDRRLPRVYRRHGTDLLLMRCNVLLDGTEYKSALCV